MVLKILLLADTHLGFDYPVKPRVERARRGDDFFNNFKQILAYAVEEKVDLVVHGGDFFFRSKIPPMIVDLAYNILYDFADNDIPIVIVPGNHERSELPISFLTSHPNIHILEEPRSMILKIAGKDVALCGFPFIRHNLRANFPFVVNELIEGIEEADLKLLCLHQSVGGARVKGFTFNYGQDVLAVGDIPELFDAVLCGHIHRRQTLWKYAENRAIPILYPGAIERTSFAEKDEEKGFYVLHFHDNQEEQLVLSRIEEVNLPTRPMIEINIISSIKNEEELKEWLEYELDHIPANSVVRVKSLDDPIKKILTASFMRSILPKTMIYTSSR